MNNRAAGGEKQIKKCGQALVIDGDAFFAFKSAYSILFGLLFCTSSVINKDQAAGTACGFSYKPFFKQFWDQPPFGGDIRNVVQTFLFFKKIKGEHIEMKFESSHLRSCTDEDNDKNTKHGLRAVTPYRQRSRPPTSCGLNTIRTCRYGPLLDRSDTTIGEVYQMKDRSSVSTALAVSTSSASYLCSHGAERRGCT